MTKENIIDILKTVYDPEIPILDIYNMGLVYDVCVKNDKVNIIMTLTNPACPMADMILEMVKNTIIKKSPNAEINIDLVFDPSWTPDLIKDDDIRKMFR